MSARGKAMADSMARHDAYEAAEAAHKARKAWAEVDVSKAKSTDLIKTMKSFGASEGEARYRYSTMFTKS